MEELTKGEIKRNHKYAERYANIIKELSDCGAEARLIEKDEPKYLKKIEQWRNIMRAYRQKFGAEIKELRMLGNDELRSWAYAGVFGESRYGQGLNDFMNDCDEYDTLYVIGGLTVKDAHIKIEIKNALKFCQNVIYNTCRTMPIGESRMKVRELSGYFFWNAKKNKVMYYEVDMGTQVWYFDGIV